MMVAPGSHAPRWRRLPEERPHQIIAAALEVFGEHGLANARLDDIARRAGVAKGTLYLYFPNKEALFREMVQQMCVAAIEERELQAASFRGTAVEQLRDYIGAMWRTVRTPLFETIYRLTTAELRSFPDLMEFFLREVVVRSLRVTERIIARGIASGEFRQTDPQVAARMLHAILIKHGVWCAQGIQAPWLAMPGEPEVLAQITEFYLHAILSNPDALDGHAHA